MTSSIPGTCTETLSGEQDACNVQTKRFLVTVWFVIDLGDDRQIDDTEKSSSDDSDYLVADDSDHLVADDSHRLVRSVYLKSMLQHCDSDTFQLQRSFPRLSVWCTPYWSSVRKPRTAWLRGFANFNTDVKNIFG